MNRRERYRRRRRRRRVSCISLDNVGVGSKLRRSKLLIVFMSFSTATNINPFHLSKNALSSHSSFRTRQQIDGHVDDEDDVSILDATTCQASSSHHRRGSRHEDFTRMDSQSLSDTQPCASKAPFWNVKPPRIERNSFLDDLPSDDSYRTDAYDESSSEDGSSSDASISTDGERTSTTWQSAYQSESNESGSFQNEGLPHSPVVYRYYGKHRSRGGRLYSIPFILFGPNVDHWKDVGRLLSMRGFSVMACERIYEEIEFVEEEDIDDNHHSLFGWRKLHKKKKTTKRRDNSEDGPNLVLDILDAMSWDQVVLVGCDSESLLAIETAMQLAPEKIAGLVLCGDLTDADRLAASAGVRVIDDFLRRIVDCPFLIVWEGDSPTFLLKGSGAARVGTTQQRSDRALVLGGGSAPHRRRPEQFAWVLSRFVEERLGSSYKIVYYNEGRKNSQGELSSVRIQLPFGLDELMSSEGRLVVGRVVATAIFYLAVARVAFIQYHHLRQGLSEVKSKYKSVDKFSRQVIRSISAFVVNYGYLPRLFRVKRVVKEVDGDQDSMLLNSKTLVITDDEADDFFDEFSADNESKSSSGSTGSRTGGSDGAPPETEGESARDSLEEEDAGEEELQLQEDSSSYLDQLVT